MTDIDLKAIKERCDLLVEEQATRLEDFRAFVGLVLQYMGKGEPYWYGDSMRQRAELLLEGKPVRWAARIRELEAALATGITIAEAYRDLIHDLLPGTSTLQTNTWLAEARELRAAAARKEAASGDT
jgi:hypothetical protein